MIALALVKLSVGALWANKLRSILTLLGVIIGVTSVMTIISALEGMMGGIQAQIERMGPTTFIVKKWGMITSEEEYLDALKRKPIELDAVEYIKDGCDLCEKVCPRVFGRAKVKYGSQALRRVRIGGSTSSFIGIVDIEVSQGRFHSHEDDLYKRQVAFIGHTLHEELFQGLDPVGRDIRIDGAKYTVIGVAKEMGSSFGENRDNFIMIPFSTYIKQFGEPRDNMNITIKAVSVARLAEAQDQVRLIMRSKRHVPYDKPDDFAIITAEDVLKLVNSVTRIFRMGLIGISSISLVVGGIVVMNIMMVSVSERTREIGIRKSIGAKRKHILLQFLYEALLTTMSGGILGIVLGYIIAKALVGMLDMEISPSMVAIVAGLSISTGTGLIFGIYPAMKAARLDPIKALSYE
ncbi:MAG: ABC transporter permease [candidate division Zixibacteria bacterium]|nr:ABC transporter permease [candidate division Zixibacteria bacterium]